MKEFGMQQWSRLCLLLVLHGSFAACSVDPKRNPFRLDAKTCAQQGDKLLVGAFCVDAMHTSDAGQPVLDAGSPGVDSGPMLSDAGTDAGTPAAGGGAGNAGSSGSMMPQAGTGAACDPDAGPVSCYTAKDKSTALQSPCHSGGYECVNGVLGTVCKNEVVPTTDGCNGMDDDCDGKTDEATSGGACTSSDPSVKGACRQGHALCRNSNLDCIPDNGPVSETCNGIDDDCDGNVDEDTATKCYPAATAGCTSDGMSGFTCQGACASGEFACVAGKYATTCSGNLVTPQPEVCTAAGADAVDENCNGVVDEGCNCTASAKCYSGTPASTAGVGPCKKGDRACTGGHFDATCIGEVTPQPETCANEGADDDCNGVNDDVAIRGTSCSTMSTAKGLCKANAVWKCMGGNAVCVDGTPSTEVCDSAGQDENCDGHVNEGFNLQTDVNNCGECGNKCSGGSTCCSGNCVNTTSSNGNCGSCGHACTTGKECCASSCINPQTDINNCGTCGTMCGLLGLLASCKSGACGL